MLKRIKRHATGEAPADSATRKKDGGRRFKSPATVRLAAIFLFLGAIIALANFDLFGGGNSAELIPRGVSIGPVDVGGKTPDEAKAELRRYLSGYKLSFVTPRGIETVGPFEDAERDPVRFHIDTALEAASGIGRKGNPVIAFAQRAGTALLGATVSIPYSLDEKGFLAALNERFGSLIAPAENARLRIAVDENGGYDIEIVPEKEGVAFDTNALLTDTRDRLRSLSPSSVTVAISTDTPELTAADLEPLVGRVGEILNRAPLAVTAQNLSWKISRSQLADWIVPIRSDKGDWTIALERDRVTKHLEAYGSSIAGQPKDAIFEMGEDGKVKTFVPSVDGNKLDVEAALNLLNDAFLGADAAKRSIDLPVTVARPNITTESSNEYGIREIIGQASTNFMGSPKNRRHNIANGAKILNGILIPPDAVFSLIGALGKIDGEHGYLEELVIKKDKTQPEYGGGLCQIGTTTFRTVMDAGLPVLERRNHSYRVSYYERDGDGTRIGPGKDATIYDPWPDFKFKNDTPAHILLLTQIEGDKLTFTFWGTKDGRKAEQGEVSIWNVNNPPPKKEIYTTDLPVGTTKCTESPHASASTVFTYTVTYPNGEVKEEKFYSYYKPWQEVCLVGATAEQVAARESAAAGKPDEADEEATPESGMSEIPPEG